MSNKILLFDKLSKFIFSEFSDYLKEKQRTHFLFTFQKASQLQRRFCTKIHKCIYQRIDFKQQKTFDTLKKKTLILISDHNTLNYLKIIFCKQFHVRTYASEKIQVNSKTLYFTNSLKYYPFFSTFANFFSE